VPGKISVFGVCPQIVTSEVGETQGLTSLEGPHNMAERSPSYLQRRPRYLTSI